MLFALGNTLISVGIVFDGGDKILVKFFDICYDYVIQHFDIRYIGQNCISS